MLIEMHEEVIDKATLKDGLYLLCVDRLVDDVLIRDFVLAFPLHYDSQLKWVTQDYRVLDIQTIHAWGLIYELKDGESEAQCAFD